MDEQLYENIISNYLKNWALPVDFLLNSNHTRSSEYLESLKQNVLLKPGVLLSTYQFLGAIPSKLRDSEGSLYWYYPEARLCKLISYSEDSPFILSFFLQNLDKYADLDFISKKSKVAKKQLYSYSVKISNPVTFLNSETYGNLWWYLDCEIDKVRVLSL